MGVTALYLPYKEEFEPIVRIGEYIAIPKRAKEYVFYEVTYIEPIQPIIIAQSLDANEEDKERELEELELADNEVGQWRLIPLDYVEIKLSSPRAAAKWVTRATTTSATPTSKKQENFLEFYTIKDEVPTAYLTNPVSEAQVVRLLVWGFKYSVKKLDYEPTDYTVLPVYSSTYVVGGEM